MTLGLSSPPRFTSFGEIRGVPASFTINWSSFTRVVNNTVHTTVKENPNSTATKSRAPSWRFRLPPANGVPACQSSGVCAAGLGSNRCPRAAGNESLGGAAAARQESGPCDRLHRAFARASGNLQRNQSSSDRFPKSRSKGSFYRNPAYPPRPSFRQIQEHV